MGAQRSKLKEVNDQMNDRLPGRCGIDRRPEGRENVNRNFGRNNRNLQRELWGTSQNGGEGGGLTFTKAEASY